MTVEPKMSEKGGNRTNFGIECKTQELWLGFHKYAYTAMETLMFKILYLIKVSGLKNKTLMLL
jgi:hypothetical protein